MYEGPETGSAEWLRQYHISRQARRATARRVGNFSTINRTKMPHDGAARKLAEEMLYDQGNTLELGPQLHPLPVTIHE